MSWLRFLHRKRSDAELQEEIEAFLAEEAADNEARGISPEEARRQARIRFGNVQKVRESLWTQNSPQALAAAGRDLKYAFRTLSRTLGFSIISIGVMALCLGAATSLFTIVRSVLLRPLPFREPDKLVIVHEYRRGIAPSVADSNYTPIAAADFYDWRSKTHGFEDMAILRYAGYNLTGERSELPELIRAAAVSWNIYQLLGVRPAFGRAFTESEDQPGSTVVMLTWSLFQRRFAGDAAIVGRQIHLDGQPFTVVGVLPSWFTYPDAGIQLWLPYRTHSSPEFLQRHDIHGSQVIARLRPDVSLANAVAQVAAVQYQTHLQYPHDPVAEDVAPWSLNDDLAGKVKKPSEPDDERHRLHVADRLSQCLESAGCAGCGTAEGSGHAQRSRSKAHHLDPPAVDGDCADLPGGRHGRHSTVGVCDSVACACMERTSQCAGHLH